MCAGTTEGPIRYIKKVLKDSEGIRMGNEAIRGVTASRAYRIDIPGFLFDPEVIAFAKGIRPLFGPLGYPLYLP